jgi:hypothetical protein
MPSIKSVHSGSNAAPPELVSISPVSLTLDSGSLLTLVLVDGSLVTLTLVAASLVALALVDGSPVTPVTSSLS